MKTTYYLKLMIGALLISALYLLFDLIYTGTLPNIADFFWGVFSNLLIVILLGYYISYSSLKGLKLSLALFAIYFSIAHFNILIEAYIFNVTDRTVTVKQITQGFFVALIFSPAFIYLFNKWQGRSKALLFKRRAFLNWLWRIFLGIFLYVLCYITAGIVLQATYPELMDFYKDKIPAVELMFLTQIPRGLLFVIIAFLILRTSNLKFIKKAVLIGFIFSIFGGIAPLIPPNEFMPGNIRFVHGIEVGVSNFLYGLILSYLLRQKMNSEPVSDETMN